MLFFLNGIFGFILAALGLGILVFFHELGHFVIAILFKVKVEAFSIGMGPALWKIKIKDTIYQIGAVPFGGFCKFKGEEEFEDVPLSIPDHEYQTILNRIKNSEEKDFVQKFYSAKLVREFEESQFIKLSSNLKDPDTIKAIKDNYIKDNQTGHYFLKDLIESEELELIKVAEENARQFITYQFNYTDNEKLKTNLYKIINSNYNVRLLRDQDSFYGSHPGKRLAIAFFGPFMNYIIAIFFIMLLAMGPSKKIEVPSEIILLDDFSERDNPTPAKQAGLLTNDIILGINGKEIKDFDELSTIMFKYTLKDFWYNIILREKLKVDVLIQRDDQKMVKTVYPEWNAEAMKYMLGIAPIIEPVIENNDDALLNKELGLQNGDRIVGIDDDYSNMCREKINHFLHLNFAAAKQSILHVKRGEEIIDVAIQFNEINHALEKNDFQLSFHYNIMDVKGVGPLSAFQEGIKMSNDMIQLSVISLYTLIFKPKKDTHKKVGGPILIGYVIGKSTISTLEDDGVYYALRNFFQFISMISLALAFFNLLPIPALDGGHIIFSLIEIVRRRPMRLKLLYKIVTGFFMVLILMAIFIAILDVRNIMEGIFG